MYTLSSCVVGVWYHPKYLSKSYLQLIIVTEKEVCVEGVGVSFYYILDRVLLNVAGLELTL